MEDNYLNLPPREAPLPAGVGSAKMRIIHSSGSDVPGHIDVTYEYRPRTFFNIHRLWMHHGNRMLAERTLVTRLEAQQKRAILDETPLWLLLIPPPWNPTREPLDMRVLPNADVILTLQLQATDKPPDIWLLGDYHEELR